MADTVAVAGGRIAWVGSRTEAEAELGPIGRRIDLGGATVVPGFIDAHDHTILLGHWLRQVDCTYPRVGAVAGIVDAIAARARTVERGQWIEARGYDDTRLAERRHPTRSDLDRASADHPILLRHVSGHMAVANSRALTLAGVGSATADPEGGRIGRDAAGDPTGLLQEGAMSLVPLPYTPQDPAVLADCLRVGGEANRAAGVTSNHEAGIFSALELGAFQEAWREGRLMQRTYLMFRIDLVDVLLGTGLAGGFGDDWLRLGAIKLMADGSLIGRTAAVSQPYLYDPRPDNRGLLTLPLEELNGQIERAHRAGWQLAVHAIGDRAIEACLDGFERAMTVAPRPDPRHRLEHCGVLRPDLIRRIAELGVIPVTQPPFITDFGDGFLRHLGPERCRLTYPLRSLLAAGIPVAGSSDAPVSSNRPLLGIQAAVTERTADGAAYAEAERLSVEEALRIYTVNAARAAFDDPIKGTIEPGRLADLAVLGADPRAVEPETIGAISVLATVLDGRFVYERPITAQPPI